MEDKKTTIAISNTLARRLRIWKAKLNAKNIEEVLDRILKIIPASELKCFDKLEEPKK